MPDGKKYEGSTNFNNNSKNHTRTFDKDKRLPCTQSLAYEKAIILYT